MNYIVLDLEWNQSSDGNDCKTPYVPFEIIQIGAVKLDRNLNLIDQFCERVRPVIYPEIHYKVQELLALQPADYKNARLFPEVAQDFFSWCGPYSYFCTWGPLDLKELQRNLKYHGVNSPFSFPLFFYDIQKIFSIVFEDRRTRRSLKFAADYLGISADYPFHDALSDAFYTAKIMQHLKKREILKNYSVDYYQLPQKRSEEIYVIYETYSKYISREFNTRLDAMKDRQLLKVPCYLCQKDTLYDIPWFVGPSKNYYCLVHCKEHGYFRGKIHFKKSESGKVFCVRTVKQISPENALQIKDLQDNIRKKRHLR